MLTSNRHTCHALECEIPVPPKMFMCLVHWSALPKLMQRRIWQTYRPGQEIDKRPSPEYLAAAHAAIHWLHMEQGKFGLHCAVCRDRLREVVNEQRAGEQGHGSLSGLVLR